MLVVRANRTPRGQVQQSLGKIGSDRVLGMIFNADDRMGVNATGRARRRTLRDYLEGPFGGVRAA